MAYTPETLFEELEPLINGLNLILVDCTYGNIKGTHHVGLIIHTNQGVGTDECAKVFRLIQPRLEILFDSREIHLEVGSPGIDRKIKHPREYNIFTGKQVKIYVQDKDWIHGKIIAADDQVVEINVEHEMHRIPLSTIGKAQLEFSWEDK
jgi:ribosome maturation factor RimP